MGEDRTNDLRVRFDAGLRLESHGAKVTSDAGLLAFRELDEALGLSQLAESVLAETRTGRNGQHELVPLLRQSVYSRQEVALPGPLNTQSACQNLIARCVKAGQKPSAARSSGSDRASQSARWRRVVGMSAQIALGLYSLREACEADLAGTLREVAAMGYAGVELTGLPGRTPSEVSRVAHELGLRLCGSPADGVPTKETLPAAVAQAKALGYRFLTGECSAQEMQDLAQLEATAARVQAIAEGLKSQGITLCLHNHDEQYRYRLGGRYPYEVLAHLAPAVMFEFDTYRAAFGGADPVQAAAALRERIPLMHAKDGRLEHETVDTAVGAGRVDVAGAIRAVDPGVLQWVVVELEDCATDKLEAVRQSYVYLTSRGLARGRE